MEIEDLSHACWLTTNATAGVLGAALGLSASAWLLAALAAGAPAEAAVSWPAPDPHVRLAVAR